MYIQVVGAGSWGLALTRLLATNGHRVRLWCREEDNPDALRETRESPVFLPGVKIPESVEISMDTDPAAEMAVLAVPSHVMRLMTERYPFNPETIRVSVAKGVETDTLYCMHEVIRDTSGNVPVAALSGPSHAEEVARDQPSLVVVANESIDVAETVQAAFNSDAFRVYTSQDVLGVELGGSLKNVMAIAAGICDGFELGDNARAALITRGLAEMSRLGAKMGADPATFAGLSGMGDLIVTCSSRHSRNHALGKRLAEGMSVEEALAASPMVAEGVNTAQSANALAEREGVEMPIAHQVYRVLYEGADARKTIADLMLRDPRPERG
jgi:glycerol-3-phosphate dehydrogenase (NAD(P)+)